MKIPMELLSYQMELLLNPSRLIVLEWARGCRKTFTLTLKIVLDVLFSEAVGRRTQWIIVSRGERQSIEALKHCTRHWQALRHANPRYTHSVFSTGRRSREYKRLELSFPGGSQIFALPANPPAIRGYTANVALDEFSLHPDDHEIWNAVYPSLRGSHKMFVASTPKGGKQRKFYELVSGRIPQFSHSRVDIYDAVRAGLPFDIEWERQAMNSPIGWAQEMELAWVDDDEAWLPFELIMANVQDDPISAGGRYFMGVDVARTRHLTVLWVLERLGDRCQTVFVRPLERMPFSEQEQEIAATMERFEIARACIDSTGLGQDMAERLRQRFGYRLEPVNFTAPVKDAIAHSIREGMERGKLTVFGDPKIVSSLMSIRRMSSLGGGFRFDAAANIEGHADYFWALGLALKASTSEAVPSIIRLPPRPIYRRR